MINILLSRRVLLSIEPLSIRNHKSNAESRIIDVPLYEITYCLRNARKGENTKIVMVKIPAGLSWNKQNTNAKQNIKVRTVPARTTCLLSISPVNIMNEARYNIEKGFTFKVLYIKVLC